MNPISPKFNFLHKKCLYITLLTEAKDNPQNVRKYLQIISSDKGKYPKYVKNQSAPPPPPKKTHDFTKLAMLFNRHFSKEHIKMVNKHM